MSEEKKINSGLKKLVESARNEEATASMQEFMKNPPESSTYTPGVNPILPKEEVTKKDAPKIPKEFGKMIPNPFNE